MILAPHSIDMIGSTTRGVLAASAHSGVPNTKKLANQPCCKVDWYRSRGRPSQRRWVAL